MTVTQSDDFDGTSTTGQVDSLNWQCFNPFQNLTESNSYSN